MNGGFEPRHHRRPKSWALFQQSVRHRWLLPFLFVDWITAWAAFYLSRTSILEFLEYCGSFSILVGVIFYFYEAPQRTKLMHYQAWQVINSAQGKGGNGGRIEALHDLNEDRVRLVGVDLSDSFLQGMQLEKADLRRGRFSGADLKDCKLSGSNFELSTMIAMNLRNAQLADANFTDVNLSDSDLTGANLHNADLTRVDLRGADLSGLVDWKSIASVRLANIHGIQNPPDGFVSWALSKGAVDQAKGN